MNTTYTALIAGANGVIGRTLTRHLQQQANWEVIGLYSRPHPQGIQVNLLDREDTLHKLSGLSRVTHIFYSAYQDRPDWASLVTPNLTMLQHLTGVMEAVAPELEHISIMQGYKVYGAHLGPFKTPARETDAFIMPPEFMTSQQQYVSRQQQGKRWTWSAMRPSVVGGFAPGNPMNLALLIAVYATISKTLGLPLRFPGKPGAYNSLLEMTDAGLLAHATVWAATTPAAANQAFNITNGDLFRWRDLWPAIARYFNMETADPLPLSLQTVMADKAALWETLREQHQLQYDYATVSAWPFGDFVFSWDYDFLSDGTRARQAGFHEYVNTQDMFFRLFDSFREQRIIPSII